MIQKHAVFKVKNIEASIPVLVFGDSVGDMFVPVQPFCQVFDINVDSQVRRITRDKRFKARKLLVTLPSGTRKYMTCLPLSNASVWFSTIRKNNMMSKSTWKIISDAQFYMNQQLMDCVVLRPMVLELNSLREFKKSAEVQLARHEETLHLLLEDREQRVSEAGRTLVAQKKRNHLAIV